MNFPQKISVSESSDFTSEANSFFAAITPPPLLFLRPLPKIGQQYISGKMPELLNALSNVVSDPTIISGFSAWSLGICQLLVDC